MTEKKKKGSVHADADGKQLPGTPTTAPRATRALLRKTKQVKSSSGRKPGKIDKEWGLTPNQMRIARRMLDAELKGGMIPSSVQQVAKVTGSDVKYIRDLLKRQSFQKYLNHLLGLEGVVLEGTFWRGLALGMQIGDIKALELYAKMTGKIDTKRDDKIEITVISPDGQPALPIYVAAEEAEIIPEESGTGYET